MRKVDLSATEKRILKSLAESRYNDAMFSDLPRKDLYVASNNLKRLGLIYAHFVTGNELFDARILDEGLVYLEENPSLENPVDDNEIKRLQKDELEYKKRIRMQERIIRYWKLSNAIVGFIALVGWLLFFFFKT